MTAQKTAAAGVAFVDDFKLVVAETEKHPLEPQSAPLHRKTFKTIIAALELLKPVAEGMHVIAPKEPTDAMIEAGDNCMKLDGD